MTLLDKLNPTTEDRLPVHQFTDSLYFWATGVVTRNDIVTAWNLDDTAGNDKEQLDEISAAYIAKATNLEKLDYMFKIEKILRLWEIDMATEAQVKTVLELTP